MYVWELWKNKDYYHIVGKPINLVTHQHFVQIM